jgi:RNA polymerase sigma factor (sigma-70 family)
MQREAVTTEAGRSVEPGRASLEELYVRHAPDARRLAYLMTGDRALAEDLTQEAFARMVGRLAHLRDREAFGAYLRQTVVNLCRMQFRRTRVERTYIQRLQRSTIEASPEPGGGVLEDLWTAIRRLPDRQRMAVVLCYYEDLSEEQAAEILRCRPGTYRSLLSRARSSLRSEMWSQRNA